MNVELFKELSSLAGPSGNEKEIKKYMKKHLVGCDEIIEDKFGGIFGVYKGKIDQPKIMICAHMDEIGAMVSEIRNDGLIKMIPIGGINPESFVALNVNVVNKDNEYIKGLVASIPPHIAKDNKITFDDLLLDIGCDSYDEVKNLKIDIGSFITPISNFFFTHDNKKMVNKAFDDRLGCGVVLELANKIKQINHDCTIVLGGTVQEEVGLRGAKVATNLIKPDLFITVDVSPAGDYLGKTNSGSLGKGFLIRYYDPRIIMKPSLLEYFRTLAIKNDIPYQDFRSQGGTDAGEAQYANDGILATTVGVPGRYIHSPQTMVHLDDIQASIDFITKLIEDFNQDTLNKLYE